MRRYKGKLIGLFILLLLSTIMACTSDRVISEEVDASDIQEKPLANFITPYRPNITEKDLLAFIEMGNTVALFDYRLKDKFSFAKLWFREYRDGLLYEEFSSPLGNFYNQKDIEGKIAIILSYDQIRMIVKTPHGGATSTENLPERYKYEGGAWDYNLDLRRQTEFVEGEEVCIFVYASNKDATSISQPQQFREEPERIKYYDNLYLVSCQFLKGVSQ